jgi:hypothetical protein
MAKQTFPQTTVRLGIHGREHSAEAYVNVSPGKLVGQQELSIDVYRGPVLDTKNFPIKLRFTRKDALLLDEGQLGFTFYSTCGAPLFAQYRYVTDVLGEDNVDPARGPCYYRVGYCPSVIEGDFIKAKTLLLPGFSSTPEHSAVRASSLTRQEKEQMLRKAEHLDAISLYESGDFSLIKWYHDHGVPQVVQMQQTVFIPAEAP